MVKWKGLLLGNTLRIRNHQFTTSWVKPQGYPEKRIPKHQLIINWSWLGCGPLPGCNRHHQDCEPFLGSGIPTQTLIYHWNTGRGVRSTPKSWPILVRQRFQKELSMGVAHSPPRQPRGNFRESETTHLKGFLKTFTTSENWGFIICNFQVIFSGSSPICSPPFWENIFLFFPSLQRSQNPTKNPQKRAIESSVSYQVVFPRDWIFLESPELGFLDYDWDVAPSQDAIVTTRIMNHFQTS